MEWRQKCDQSKKKLDNLFTVLSLNLKSDSDINTQNIMCTIDPGKKLQTTKLGLTKSSRPEVEVSFENKAYKTEKEFKSEKKIDVNPRYTPEIRLNTIQASETRSVQKEQRGQQLQFNLLTEDELRILKKQ
jgi:hypothetical protein